MRRERPDHHYEIREGGPFGVYRNGKLVQEFRTDVVDCIPYILAEAELFADRLRRGLERV